MEKLIIAWIVDVPGWAYDNRAKRIERALPDYHHVRFFNIAATIAFNGKAFMMWIVDQADVIVCPDPRLLKFFTDEMRPKIVQNLNAIKIFEKDKTDGSNS